ncbi:serine/threonine-protein phosphatase 6 regulatory ankyrin repeat subunit C-like [Haematococcus lacustris]|uniref:Serine/threonine-protein phosphatase 6 regulatory ankyrin repeat subunit C-like n=1 Tax=Haematococcus lacustris TaxID=44745 RepID=A0A699ZPU9_HAELA|nr:serine/threonine-protein phosphatase 6 regulatory ankyrin repeat subunit C-like [Haematococcus lacustris]
MLLAAGADPSQQNKFRQTPLHFACACGNIHAAAVLIGCGGVDTQEAKGMTPLMLAAKRGAADLMLALIQAGQEAEAQRALQAGLGSPSARASGSGASALLLASEQDMKKLVTQLLACKVDVNQARWDGATPLLVATRKRAMAAVKLLINAGADVNQSR